VKDYGTRADHRIVANPDRTEQDRIGSDVDVVPDGWTVRRTVLHSNRRAVAKGAIASEDRSFMDHQSRPMVEPQPRTNFRFEIQLDAEHPFHIDDIESHDRGPEKAKGRTLPSNNLRSAIQQHHTAALPIPGIGLPILKDFAFHLRSGSFMQVHFYLPERYLPDPGRQEAWRSGKITQLEEAGKIACAQCWIYQTWLALERSGFPANLTHSLPSDGTLVALTNCVSADFRASERVFFVGVVADHVAHPRAHLHLVQNKAHAQRLWSSAFMPLWPHPNLIPRNPARLDRFENVCFFGESANLARELADSSWRKRLRDKLGLNFVVCGADRWHDYSEADCVVAVRGFGRSVYIHKPATKLYNAWLAGVPFIGGMDSAYAADGRPGRDFLQASTTDELFARIRVLQERPALREQLVAAGKISARNFSFEATLDRWKRLLDHTVPELAARWRRKSVAGRRVVLALQTVSVWLDTRLRH
jgi:hypothetical protein